MTLPEKYPDEFQECIAHVLESEGGYVWDRRDPGGETNYGISKRAFPKLNIKTLTKEQAIEIYYTHYWLPIRPHLIPAHLRFAVFDCAVNSGVATAIRLLQELAGVTADGIMGRVTAARSVNVSLEQYLAARERLYRGIVRRRPASRVFLANWLHRLRAIRRWVAEAWP